MKVAFATDYLPKYHNIWGGGEQACLRISKMMSKNGYQMSILSTKPNVWPNEEFKFFVVRVIEDFFPEKLKYTIRQFKTAFFPFDLLSLFSSYFILRKLNPQVLHLHNIHSLSFSLVIAARLLKIPVCISIYDYGIICPIGFLWILKNFNDYEGINCEKFHGIHCIDCIIAQKTSLKYLSPFVKLFLFLRTYLLNMLLKKIDGFVVLSSSNADVLVDFGIPRQKIGVVQIPLDEPDFEEELEKNSILFIGWLHPRKGPHVIVKAMPYILKEVPEAKLYIFGDEKGNKPYKDTILNFIRQRNLEDKIVFLGRRPHEEVRGFLKKASVLVIPETWETIATNTLTEGLTYGKAIVASRVGGSKDYITHKQNGLLVRNNDPADFAQKIVSILKDQGLAKWLRKNARESWYELFSEDKVHKRLISFYKMISIGKVFNKGSIDEKN